MLIPGLLTAQETSVRKPLVAPGTKPEIFAPGMISTPFTEWSTSFTPAGDEVYSSRGAIYWTIISSKKVRGTWQTPVVAAFSGQFRDTDPFITPDGKRLFFVSSRPQAGAPQGVPQRALHLWFVDRLPDGSWGEPHHLDSAINAKDVSNFAPSVSLKGTLYFSSRDRNGHAGMSSYSTKWLGNHYDTPQLISFEGFEEIQDPFIDPKERYLLFVSGADIYISYHKEMGWSTPEKLPAEVNNGDGNSSPYVSKDGKVLYYSSARWQGFYKRDQLHHRVTYDEVVKENNSLFNNQPNILMVPVRLSDEDLSTAR